MSKKTLSIIIIAIKWGEQVIGAKRPGFVNSYFNRICLVLHYYNLVLGTYILFYGALNLVISVLVLKCVLLYFAIVYTNCKYWKNSKQIIKFIKSCLPWLNQNILCKTCLPFFLDNLLCGSVKNTQTAGKTICFTHILIMVSHILNIKMLIIPSSKCLNAEMIQKNIRK